MLLSGMAHGCSWPSFSFALVHSHNDIALRFFVKCVFFQAFLVPGTWPKPSRNVVDICDDRVSVYRRHHLVFGRRLGTCQVGIRASVWIAMDTGEEAGVYRVYRARERFTACCRAGLRFYPLLPREKNTVTVPFYYTVEAAVRPKYTVQFILPFCRTIRCRAACSGFTGPTSFSKTCMYRAQPLLFWRRVFVGKRATVQGAWQSSRTGVPQSCRAHAELPWMSGNYYCSDARVMLRSNHNVVLGGINSWGHPL